MPSLNTKLASAPNTQTNYVLKATSSTTIGNSLIFDNGTNVGIGNTNTTYTLDVSGTIRATGSIFGDIGFRTKSLNGYLLKNDADSANLGGLVRRSYWAGGASLDTQIFAETGYGIFLNVNGSSTTGMTITSAGNVLIGSNANSADTSLLTIKQASTSFTNGIYLERGGERNGYFMYVGGALDALTFRRNYFGTQSDVMSLTRDGNVGIGTSSPSYKLDVHNGSDFDIRLRDTSLGGTVGILFETANDFSGTSQAYIKGIGAGNSGVSQLIFGTAGASGDTSATERMRITSGGNVGLNTTNPQARLHIAGAGGSEISFAVYDGSARRTFFIPSQYYGYMWACEIVSNGGKAWSFGSAGGGGEVGTIVVNASSTAYNTTSDYRLKEDLKDFNGLELLSKIKVYDFKWKKEDARTHGVMAHELQEILPYAVSGEKDAINHEGKIEAQSVDYSKIVPSLVKAIQEQQAQIEELKALINK